MTNQLAKDCGTSELYGIIGRVTAFVDFGWRRRLKPIEADLYLYLARRAGRGDVFQCPASELAEYLDHKVEESAHPKSYRAIRVALSSLERHKLIQIGQEPWVGARSYRVFVPPKVDQSDPPKVDQFDPPSGSIRSTEWINSIHRVDQFDPPCNIEKKDKREGAPAPLFQLEDSPGKANAKPGRKTDPGIPPGLQEFWNGYPQRGKDRSSRAQCLKFWTRDHCEDRAAEIIAALKQWLACKDWQKSAGDFILGAHRFLETRKWADAPTSAGPTPAKPQQDLTVCI